MRTVPGNRLPRRLELLEEDRDADVAGMDPERRGQLEDLHDLLRRRAVAQRLLDVLPDPGHVQVGRRGVDGDVDELLDLRLERAVAPGDAREVRVRLEEVLVQLEQAVPERAPVPARVDELVAQLLLVLGQLGAHLVVSPLRSSW